MYFLRHTVFHFVEYLGAIEAKCPHQVEASVKYQKVTTVCKALRIEVA